MFDAYGRGDLDGMMRVRNAAKLWMVEARPAYSDEFWSA